MGLNHISYYCQGESHKATEKPCQDHAGSGTTPLLSYAIVSDGHGGERYFRSQIGAQLAVEITKEAVTDFVKTLPSSVYCRAGGKNLFKGLPFTQYGGDETPSHKGKQAERVHEALTGLFSYIIGQWNIRIAQNAVDNDLTGWELEYVEQKYLDEFRTNRESDHPSFEKTYGCTLMAYIQTAEYWFAFHIGDGKFISFSLDGTEPVFAQPIPWDERCFLNKTTSICDSNALDEFRYCYQGDGGFPEAVFLGSDGMDDSYGDGDKLVNFYIQLYKLTAKKGKDVATKELQMSLPLISKKGSKDDMSVACVYDEEKLHNDALLLVKYQIKKIQEMREEVKIKISKLESEIGKYGNLESIPNSEKIAKQYAEKDLQKAIVLDKRLISRIGHLSKEARKL